jgi:hypothetical protein
VFENKVFRKICLETKCSGKYLFENKVFRKISGPKKDETREHFRI